MGELSLEERIARLEAIEEIKRLKHHYMNSCDLQLPDEVRDCFVENGAIIHYKTIGRFEGRDAFVAVYEEMGCNTFIHDMHHAQNPEIIIHDDATASGRWSLFYYMNNSNDHTGRQLSGFYDDEYVKENGKWKIKTSIFDAHFITDITQNEAGAVRLSLVEE